MNRRGPGIRTTLAVILLIAFVSVAAGKSGSPTPGARVVLATDADQKMDAPLRLALERSRELSAAAGAGRGALPTSGRLFDRALTFGQLRPGPGGEPQLDVFMKLSPGG